MIGLIADVTLSIGWWTIKKVAGGIYYFVYQRNTEETQEQKDIKVVTEELNQLKLELKELKEKDFILLSSE